MKIINYLKYRVSSFLYLLRYIFLNLPQHFFYLISSKKRNSIEEQIIDNLNNNGYHICKLDDIFQNKESKHYLDKFHDIAAEGYKSEIFKKKHEEYIQNFDKSGKHYIFKFIDNLSQNILSKNHPLIEFGTSEKILNIINGYFKLQSKLQGTEIWHTFYSNKKNQLMNAQRWHRDRCDLNIIKIYLYLNDVDEENGAMDFIPNSLRNKKYQNLSKFSFGNIEPWKVYPNDDRINNLDKKEIIKFIGKKGTIVFVNTVGLHRGGRALKKERLFCMWSYVTPASLSRKKKFNLANDFKFDLSKPGNYALK